MVICTVIKFVVDCEDMYRFAAKVLLLISVLRKVYFLCSYLKSGTEFSNDCLQPLISVRTTGFGVGGLSSTVMSYKVFLEASCCFLL